MTVPLKLGADWSIALIISKQLKMSPNTRNLLINNEASIIFQYYSKRQNVILGITFRSS